MPINSSRDVSSPSSELSLSQTCLTDGLSAADVSSVDPSTSIHPAVLSGLPSTVLESVRARKMRKQILFKSAAAATVGIFILGFKFPEIHAMLSLGVVAIMVKIAIEKEND